MSATFVPRVSRRGAPIFLFWGIGLPVMDGYDLARRIRELNALAPIRLISLTGYGQEHDRERSCRSGFDLHLTKPVELDDMRAPVEDA